MFAKIFGQIFDSSIAEDYNCRRMFMDLLVLADPTGAVDMTAEAISRRTNVPLPEVEKYLKELNQPDPTSRSKKHEGRRIVRLDSNRDWGWIIVNYAHYRTIRDEEVRRSYFRDAQRKYRASKDKEPVKDKVLTGVDKVGQVLTPSSTSSSDSSSAWLEELKNDEAYKDIDVVREFHRAARWYKENKQPFTRRKFIGWLNRTDKRISGVAPPQKFFSFEDRKKRKGEIQQELNDQYKYADNRDQYDRPIFTEEEKLQRERLKTEMKSL